MSRPRALILDYGYVLCGPQSPEHIARMAARLEVPPAAFSTVYWAERLAYDAGESPEAYWRKVAAGLDRAARFDPTLLAAMIEDDTRSWCDYREEVWELAGRFRARGGRLGLLSNNIPPLMARLRATRGIDAFFDVVTASCEVGLAKPGEAIYRRCLDALGVAPEDALFVDDVPANVATAERLGMSAFLFQGDDAIARLRAAVEAWSASF